MESTLLHLAHHWLLVISSLCVIWLVRNRYYNGLSAYPGPTLASLTDWWRFIDVYGQQPQRTHQELHAKYGDIVRLGPNALSFANPAALKDIYGLNKGFVKVPDISFLPLRTVQLTKCVVRLLHSTTVRGQGT